VFDLVCLQILDAKIKSIIVLSSGLNLVTYFKSDFLSNLSREYQYAIQYNSLGKNIDKLNACHIDAEFEAIYAYMNYKNITLNEALSDLSNKCTLSSVDIKYIRKIYKIVSEGKNE